MKIMDVEYTDKFRGIVHSRLLANPPATDSQQRAYDRWVQDIDANTGDASLLGFSWGQNGLIECVAHLLETMPVEDLEGEWHDGIDLRYLADNCLWALHVKNAYPWPASIPHDVYLDYVMPYAVVDEDRCVWRHQFQEAAERCWATGPHSVLSNDDTTDVILSIIRGIPDAFGPPKIECTSNSDASIGVADTLKTRRTSPMGMSVLVIYALRAAGFPARLGEVSLEGKKRVRQIVKRIVVQKEKRPMSVIPRSRHTGPFTSLETTALSQESVSAVVVEVWTKRGWYFVDMAACSFSSPTLQQSDK